MTIQARFGFSDVCRILSSTPRSGDFILHSPQVSFRGLLVLLVLQNVEETSVEQVLLIAVDHEAFASKRE
jgi:hypothetical protein